jgi:hypothetical protein
VEWEYHILKKLEGGTGITHAHWFDLEASYDTFVLDLLGPSLHKLLDQHGKFNISTIIHVADQMVCHSFMTYGLSLVLRVVVWPDLLSSLYPLTQLCSW